MKDENDTRKSGGNAPFLSNRDRQAMAAYDEHVKREGLPHSEKERGEWVREWRALDEEQRQDMVEAERWANRTRQEPLKLPRREGPDMDKE